MNDKEIVLFTDAVQLAKDEFFIDAINKFDQLILSFPDSELCDDAYYNKGLCYFKSGQFEKAKEQFYIVINDYPQSTISVLSGNNEFGKTPTKCAYAIINCYLATGNLNETQALMNMLENDKETYVLRDDEKVSFYELSKNLINNYKEANK
tara:strand:+ start:928 stop:1380 length:453 start_codon:yes stop_codon:yes gene_type:complete